MEESGKKSIDPAVRLYMDSSSFANIRPQAVRYDCSRIFGLVLLHLLQVLDPDGLFARGFPIASTGSKASDIIGFHQRRFDLSAITRIVMQSSSDTTQ